MRDFASSCDNRLVFVCRCHAGPETEKNSVNLKVKSDKRQIVLKPE
jgi:hypothetical protein